MKSGYFSRLQLIYKNFARGQVALLAIIFLVSHYGSLPALSDKSLTLALTIALSIVSLSGLSLGHVLYRIKTTEALKKEDLPSRLAEYRLACVLRWSLVEFPALLALVAFFITANKLFLAGFGILSVYFLFLRPGLEQIVQLLKLSEEETYILTTPDESDYTG